MAVNEHCDGGTACRLSGQLVKGLEKLGSRWRQLGSAYRKQFYRDMIEQEIHLVSPSPRSSILHVGCGPLPMTALKLVRRGFEVTAVDSDPEAVEKAEQFCVQHKISSLVNVQLQNGSSLRTEEFDAIWVSLHVNPKEKVLSNLLSGMKAGARLVYRNPRGHLALFYPRIDPSKLAPQQLYESVETSLGKELVLIEKESESNKGEWTDE